MAGLSADLRRQCADAGTRRAGADQCGARVPAYRRPALRRSDARHGAVPRTGGGGRLRRRDELPDRRADRRQVPQRPGRDWHGLCARGRGAGAGLAHGAVHQGILHFGGRRRSPWRKPASTISSSISATVPAARSARKTVMSAMPRSSARPRSSMRCRRKFSDRHRHLSRRRDRNAGRLRATSSGRAASRRLCRRLLGGTLSDRDIGHGGRSRVQSRQAGDSALSGGPADRRGPRRPQRPWFRYSQNRT